MNGLRLIGHRIRGLREDLGMSQEGLATILVKRYGVKATQGSIGGIETNEGKRLPSVPVLVALSMALDVSTDYLLGLTDDQSPPEPRMVSEVQKELERIFAQLSPTRQREVLVIARALVDDQSETSVDEYEQVINAALDLLIGIDPATADTLLSQLSAGAMPIARRLVLRRQRAE